MEGLIFECFDLALDTDFTAFNASIANSPPIDCAADMIYAYQVVVSFTILTDAAGINAVAVLYSPGDVRFDPEFALNVSMYSNLVSDIAPSPTSAAGNETMSPSVVPVAPSAAAKVTVTGSAFLLGALALLL